MIDSTKTLTQKEILDYCQKNPDKCQVQIIVNREPVKTDKIAADKFEVQTSFKKGAVPTGKGLVGGVIVGGASSAILAAGLSESLVGLFGDMTVGNAAKAGSVIGGVIGGVAGAITANFTDNKTTAAIIGGVVGGAATLALGTGFLIGTVAGATGAAAGAYLAQKK